QRRISRIRLDNMSTTLTMFCRALIGFSRDIILQLKKSTANVHTTALTRAPSHHERCPFPYLTTNTKPDPYHTPQFYIADVHPLRPDSTRSCAGPYLQVVLSTPRDAASSACCHLWYFADLAYRDTCCHERRECHVR